MARDGPIVLIRLTVSVESLRSFTKSRFFSAEHSRRGVFAVNGFRLRAMIPRFFCETPITSSRVTVSGTEMHHLVHVHRSRQGTQVILFDGSGHEFLASVVSIARNGVEMEVLERASPDREASVSVTMGIALPKGDRQTWLVEKAVELGVERLVPLNTQRAVVQPASKALSRLRRTVVQASKQCRRNRLMQIGEPLNAAEFFRTCPPNARRLIAHPEPGREGSSITAVAREASTDVFAIAVGPEGGFTDQEVRAALHVGWQTVSLGPRILRIETAALSLAAAVILTAEERTLVRTELDGQNR